MQKKVQEDVPAPTSNSPYSSSFQRSCCSSSSCRNQTGARHTCGMCACQVEHPNAKSSAVGPDWTQIIAGCEDAISQHGTSSLLSCCWMEDTHLCCQVGPHSAQLFLLPPVVVYHALHLCLRR